MRHIPGFLSQLFRLIRPLGTLACAVITTGLLLLPAAAETISLNQQTVHYDLPANWILAPQTPQRLLLRSADKQLEVLLWLVESKNGPKVMNGLLGQLMEKMTKITARRKMIEPMLFNGYTGFFIDGSGMLGGESIEWKCFRAELKDSSLVITAMSRPGLSKQDQADFEQLMKSISLAEDLPAASETSPAPAKP